MKDLDLSFLSTVKLEVVTKEAATPVKKTNNPIEADLRVFARGSAFASAVFIAEYVLEFQAKSAKDQGSGLDVFTSEDWPMVNLPKEVIFTAIVPKKDPKVDMFSKTSYEGDTPKSTAISLSNSTFVKAHLLDMLAKAYEIDWATTKYVDLSISKEHQMVSPTGEYWIPKTVSRGERKGEKEILIRKDCAVFPLVVVHEERMEDSTPEVAPEINMLAAAPKVEAPEVTAPAISDASVLGSEEFDKSTLGVDFTFGG